MQFEINDYKSELSDTEILEDIKRVASGINTDYIPISTYKKLGKYSQTAIQNHFGTWVNALTLAGLRSKRTAKELKRISDEEYYADLKRVAELINSTTVPYDSYKRYGTYSCEHIIKRFGKWNTALQQAGLEETGFSKERISEQQCFDEIERMWRVLGRQPTTTDIIKGGISLFSIDTFKRRFGGWRKALEAFVEYINQNDTDTAVDNDGARDFVNTAKSEAVTEKAVSNDTVEANETNLEKDYVAKQKKHRTSRNVNTRLRYKVLQRDHFKCCACGASPAKDPAVELHVDHIVPWSNGGETELNNLQTLCSKCNLGKSNCL